MTYKLFLGLLTLFFIPSCAEEAKIEVINQDNEAKLYLYALQMRIGLGGTLRHCPSVGNDVSINHQPLPQQCRTLQ